MARKPAPSGKPSLTSKGAARRAERERAVGLDPADEAARWLDENDTQPDSAQPAGVSKSARKSKALHRFRQRQERDG
jgi:hypothetical protein